MECLIMIEIVSLFFFELEIYYQDTFQNLVY